MAPRPRSRTVFHCARPSSASRCTIRKAMSQAPSLTGSLERKEARGEAGSERGEHRRSEQAALERALEHEQHARRRHVAVAAQHLALVAQRALLQIERRFHSVEHLGTARMKNELRRLDSRRLEEAARIE